jgi:hypothetical protein
MNFLCFAYSALIVQLTINQIHSGFFSKMQKALEAKLTRNGMEAPKDSAMS